MKSLIVGMGQVGKGLYENIKDHHETETKDVEVVECNSCEVLHVCFPFSDQFVQQANNYIGIYKPKLTIVHSSVPIGTTRKLNGLVCYSPIRGKHPNLAGDIKVFEKYVAGKGPALVMATEYFKVCGIEVVGFDDNMIESLEFCKLMTNIRYGYELAFMQEVERISKKYGLSVDLFRSFERSYTKGYKQLDQEHMIRPDLYPGFIGGHCVIQCTEILQKQWDSIAFDWIKMSNKMYELEHGKGA